METKPRPMNYDTSKYKYSFNEVRDEIKKPFEEKLKRSQQLIKMFANSPNACLSCSFGKDSMVVLHLVQEENPQIPVNFNNTLCEFPETLKFKDQIAECWNLRLSELRPEKGVNFWTIQKEIALKNYVLDDGKKHSNICCYHLKERPFKLWRRALGLTKAFTGITASESRNRFTTACMKGTNYYTWRDGLYRIHPILFWTKEEVWNFIKDNHIPINPAYQKYNVNRLGCMWCMSYKTWREQVARLNPKIFCYMLQNFVKDPQRRLVDPKYYEDAGDIAQEVYA
jgi:phosphoadenosine phosphosulfate reductase